MNNSSISQGWTPVAGVKNPFERAHNNTFTALRGFDQSSSAALSAPKPQNDLFSTPPSNNTSFGYTAPSKPRNNSDSESEVNSKVKSKSQIMKFIGTDSQSYFERFVNANETISEALESPGKYNCILDRDKLLFPGLSICYIVIKRNSGTSSEKLISILEKYSRYETIFDFLPESESDELPGLCKILEKISNNDLYDFVYFHPGLPACVRCIIENNVATKKLKNLKTKLT